MKFKGKGIIWNPKGNCPLAKFDAETNEFETEDKAVIEKLKELKFKEIIEGADSTDAKTDNLAGNLAEDVKEASDAETAEPGEDSGEISDDFQALRKLAKEQKIPDYITKTKAELQKLLKK